MGTKSDPPISGTAVESRFFFEGPVTATDMSRASDAREASRIGIFGTSNSYGGSYGRVTNEALGRDLNPLGRGAGQALVGGMLNLGTVLPSLPKSLLTPNQGNSVNNDVVGSPGGGYDAPPPGGGSGSSDPCNDARKCCPGAMSDCYAVTAQTREEMPKELWEEFGTALSAFWCGGIDGGATCYWEKRKHDRVENAHGYCYDHCERLFDAPEKRGYIGDCKRYCDLKAEKMASVIALCCYGDGCGGGVEPSGDPPRQGPLERRDPGQGGGGARPGGRGVILPPSGGGPVGGGCPGCPGGPGGGYGDPGMPGGPIAVSGGLSEGGLFGGWSSSSVQLSGGLLIAVPIPWPGAPALPIPALPPIIGSLGTATLLAAILTTLATLGLTKILMPKDMPGCCCPTEAARASLAACIATAIWFAAEALCIAITTGNWAAIVVAILLFAGSLFAATKICCKKAAMELLALCPTYGNPQDVCRACTHCGWACG